MSEGYGGTATAGGGFNSNAAGNKMYGQGRPMPTIGPVDPLGYAERDRKTKARRNSMLAQIQALQGQNAFSAENLGGPLQNG